ncbi:MAG: TolC family protein [Ignavibacteriaceae bacterium]
MGIRKYIVNTFLLVIFFSSVISAQEEKTLTLDESLQIGLENSNMLHSSKMKVNYADARLSEINTNMLPSLKFSAAYTRLSPITPFVLNTPFGDFNISPNILDNYNLKLTLQQPIFTGFKLSSSSNIAEYNYKATEESYNKDKQDLIYNIKNAYWNLFKAKKVKEVTDQNVEQVKAHLMNVQNFYEQGLSTKNDLLKVQVQLSESELRQIDAKNAVKLARINLFNVIGIPLNTNSEIPDSVDIQTSLVNDLDSYIEKALVNRPELKAIQYNIKAGEAGVTLAESSWYPQIYLGGNYYYSKPNQRIFPAENKFKDTWDVGVSVQVDLWNWGSTTDKTDQAEAQLEEVKDSYKIVKDNIVLEVNSNYLNLEQSRDKIAVAEESVSQAKENYRVTDETFKKGLALNSDLLDSEVALLQSNTNYIQALVDYELARARLEKSIGGNLK